MADHPLDIRVDEASDTVTVCGVTFTGTFFRLLADPRVDRLYRVARDGPKVTLTAATARDLWDALRSLGAAKTGGA